MIDSFNSAADLYESGTHPRLILGPGEVDKLRARIRSGDGALIMEALRRKVGLLVDEFAGHDDVHEVLAGDGSHNSLGARLSYGINDIAMVALLDDDAAAIAAIHRLFDAVISPDAQRGRVGVPCLALPFDLLYHTLTPAMRTAYVQAGERSIHSQVENRVRRDATLRDH